MTDKRAFNIYLSDGAIEKITKIAKGWDVSASWIIEGFIKKLDKDIVNTTKIAEDWHESR